MEYRNSALARRLVPPPLRRAAKEAFHDFLLGRAIRAVMRTPAGKVPDRNILADLRRGWDNDGFSADLEYLEETATRAAAAKGSILECGSGLTSIMLGALAGRRGVDVWSLEHDPEWAVRTMVALRRHRIPRVNVCTAPLREYGSYSWYEPPLDQMPDEFSLVICDGPPGTTPGGRYGLMPLLKNRLPSGSLILLDDVDRPGEAEVIERWKSEFKVSVRVVRKLRGSFALVTVP